MLNALAIAAILLFPSCGLAQAENNATVESSTQQPQVPNAVKHKVDFAKDVQPILDSHCSSCHGASKQTSDLRLDLRAAVLKGSGSGPVIRVGDSVHSRLIEVVAGIDPDYRMPPEGPKLSDEEIGVLRAWIDQGALGPDDSAELDRKAPWSFQPVARPPSPHGAAAIDNWLTLKLNERGLAFSQPANRSTQIRRLYLIALGVPPTPEETREFLSDSSSDAYERLVDRVMADVRYGERMARHWFDVVRFAESNGFETNRVRYNAWPYRDYVIRSFNNDLPYDQFIAQQIAGDALGTDVATGYLVAGTYDIVKSPDINLTLMQRQDELSDLINTTGTAFLGLTLGCARCHDHKFDPVTQKDFYALQAVFAGVNFGERPLPAEPSEQSQQQLAQLQSEIESNKQRIAALLSQAKTIAANETKENSERLRPPVNSKLNIEEFESIKAVAVRFNITASGNSQPCIDEWEVFNASGENVAAADRGSKPSASSALPGYSIHRIEHINDGKPGNDHSWISNETNGGFVRIDFAQPEMISRMQWGRDRAERFRDRVASVYSIEALLEDGTWRELASSKNRRPQGDDIEWMISQLPSVERAEFKRVSDKQKQLEKELQQLTKGQSAWLGTFSKPEPIHRLYRGDPLMKREEVAPAMVDSLHGPQLASDLPEQQRRVALVSWLTERNNPLTSRVMVNRLWHYTFGTGIVDTPSDFGGNGTLPTHPELLDWLADEFMASGWSIKHVQRLMLLSQAFQQSSQPSQAGLAVDSDSRFLWRFPPRRLEAEPIRDSMLVVTGAIDWQMGGPGFFLQRVEQDNVYRYFPKETFGPAEMRRMVYLTRVRGEQDPVFGSFDCPSGNQVIPKRSRSNTPLQALNLFNSSFIQQQADLLAERLRRDAGESAQQQVERTFELLFARQPDQFELDASTQMIQDEGLQAFCRAMLNTTEFLFVF